MKDRLKKKEEKRKRELIHQILDIVLDINGTGVRKQSVTGNLPTAFFDFSGHVADLDVRLYRDGWSSDNSAKWVLQEVSTNNIAELKRAIRTLKCETPGAATPRASR